MADLTKQLELVRQHTIFEIVHGSRSYGTSTPTSDTDVKGVCIIPDPRLYFGMQRFNQQDRGWECDKVIYHLPKFMELAGKCNPNIIEILFVDSEHILKINKYGQKLLASRELFLSKRARWTFNGYAVSSLKKIKAKSPETFDRKDAMHLVRLLRCGYEIMAEGKVRVKRPDAAELLSIRNGAWSYEKILAYANEMDTKLEEAYQKSTLPNYPNWKAIEQLQMELIQEYLKEHKINNFPEEWVSSKEVDKEEG